MVSGVWLHSVKNYCNALALASNGTERVDADDPGRTFVLARLAHEQRQGTAGHGAGVVAGDGEEAGAGVEAQAGVAAGESGVAAAGTCERHSKAPGATAGARHLPLAEESVESCSPPDPLAVELEFLGSPFCRMYGDGDIQ